jgi:titin
VQNLKVKGVTEDTVSLTWEDPKDDGGCMLSGYVVEKRETGKRSWSRVDTCTEVEFEVTKLTEGQTYNFQVAAENEVGVGQFKELTKGVAPKSGYGKLCLYSLIFWSNTMDFSTATEPPGPPSAPEPSDITKESCTLTWKEPEENGGTPVTGYFIERCTAESSRWLRITKESVEALTYDCKDLVEGTNYKFRVVAVNKMGEGPAGPESTPFTAKDPWGTFML